jgi:hypothetical protein
MNFGFIECEEDEHDSATPTTTMEGKIIFF